MLAALLTETPDNLSDSDNELNGDRCAYLKVSKDYRDNSVPEKFNLEIL